MSKIKVAAVQMRCAPTVEENLQHAEALVREAAANGAQIILLPELWERPYFCQQRRYDFYQYALPTEENPAVQMGKRLAKELNIVLPISFFERDVNELYNSIACIDADGEIKRIFLTIIFIRKNSILNRVTAALRFLIPSMAVSVSVSAGISGFLRQHAAWR